jgi:NADPH-dependent 2,4-dienoyl-CoA reductase/sulfur reductase-like enzyme
MGEFKMNNELVIIGSGPAGLSAAIEASKCGVKVLVIDENNQPGGQLFLQTHKFFGSKHHSAGVRGFQIGYNLLQEAKDLGVELLQNSAVWGIFPDLKIAFSDDMGKGGYVNAKNILIATGALEKPVFFEGWTKPGVMGAGAAQNMMHVYWVLPGKKVLILGSGNVGLIVAYQLAQAGADVVGVIDMLPKVSGYQVHAGKIRRLGIPIMTSLTIQKALGSPAVEGARLIKVDESGKHISGTEFEISCDLICLAVGLKPFDELCWSSGIKMKYMGGLGGYVPIHNDDMQTTKPCVYVAGDITGVEEANTAMEEGRLAGVAVAQKFGKISEKRAEQIKGEIRERLAHLRLGSFGKERAKAKEMLIKLSS